MENEDILFTCCHCNNIFIVNTQEFNCKIIRHAIYKKTLTQIDPHLSKPICDKLIKNNEIYGCGKPLKIVKTKNKWTVEICEYI
jgi:hypothetical protein